ncbi:PaaI family thioesterase [Mesobacterium sp. TK19101]|uniref:PaaI family thioesterase n=1 Tax=Mesobacterium hydrothermale TaxID=3111907 RepID=A0ABU6HF89_9RHOB|nr:PaaI family thioesterase [Mesobacterium sp. TK19101]MEC3861133.1 PaaI family thioesterase [Mesobacterium sp. TK19101]
MREAAEGWLRDYFADWVRALDLTIEEIGPEGVVMSMPISDAIRRSGGIASGQALAALADTAMVFACAGHFGAFVPVATTTLDTRFLRPASGARLRCEATVIRAGKAIVFAEARLLDLPSGKAVAQASATFFKP